MKFCVDGIDLFDVKSTQLTWCSKGKWKKGGVLMKLKKACTGKYFLHIDNYKSHHIYSSCHILTTWDLYDMHTFQLELKTTTDKINNYQIYY